MLAWGLACFACSQLLLDILMDRRHAEIRFPEYGGKLAALRARLAERPGHPLVLALGSSRTLTDFRPEVIRRRLPLTAGEWPVLFNFGLIQADPVMELLCLRQLLAEGIRPAWLVLEVTPPFLDQAQSFVETRWRNTISRMGWDDLWVLRRYHCRLRRLLVPWFLSRLTPCFSQRMNLLDLYAPDWLPPQARQHGWQRLDRDGWFAFSGPVSQDRYRQAVEETRRHYAPPLNCFHIAPLPDQALREILAACRDEGIHAILLLLPESTEFRSWYPPAVRAELDAYLSRLNREYGVPLVDGRTWVPDTGFLDGHHLLADGAIAFSERLGHEVIEPSLAGNTLPAQLSGKEAP
jgi:hypothetical protein